MALPVNAPVVLKYVSSEGNSGNSYDIVIESSVNNILIDWRAASTPVFNAVSVRPKFLAGHFKVIVRNEGYATPIEAKPVAFKAVVSISHGTHSLVRGQQAFSNIAEGGISAALTLATPV